MHMYFQDFDVNDAKSSVESDKRDGCTKRTSLLLGVDLTDTAATPSETADLQPNGSAPMTGRTANGGASDQPTSPKSSDEPSSRRPVRRGSSPTMQSLGPETCAAEQSISSLYNVVLPQISLHSCTQHKLDARAVATEQSPNGEASISALFGFAGSAFSVVLCTIESVHVCSVIVCAR